MALKGLKVIELVGLAPAPFCGMILSDFGAQVLRIDNPNNMKYHMFANGKDTMFVDLKTEQGSQILNKISAKSDILIDPFRPGVLERLGLGPEKLCEQNPRLIYSRLSSYGQTGPLSQIAAHDINFVSLSGVMSRLGHEDRTPIAPLNLLGDFAGGAVLCAMGIMMALFERERSGKGQVIDHSMTEGAAYISSFIWETLRQKDLMWPNWPRRGSNLLDFGAPFYRCYETKDRGNFISVGALEEKFYQNFANTIGLIMDDQINRFEVESWPALTAQIADIIRTKTRAEWTEIFDGVDACVTPVLSVEEASGLEHHRQRNAFCSETGLPNPAPKLSRTPAVRKNINEKEIQSQTKTILKQLGYCDEDIQTLADNNVIDQD